MSILMDSAFSFASFPSAKETNLNSAKQRELLPQFHVSMQTAVISFQATFRVLAVNILPRKESRKNTYRPPSALNAQHHLYQTVDATRFLKIYRRVLNLPTIRPCLPAALVTINNLQCEQKTLARAARHGRSLRLQHRRDLSAVNSENTPLQLTANTKR